MLLKLPEEVEKRLVHLGPAGEQWQKELPDKLSRLRELWAIEFGAVLHGGSEALVVEVERQDATPAVLKLLLPATIEPGQTEELANKELQVLLAAGGRGYVEVLEADEISGAMLLQKLGEPLGKIETDTAKQQHILCETLKSAWQPATADLGLQTGAEKAVWLREFIQSLAPDFALTPEALSTAVEFTHQREAAHESATKVLVHGDVHEFNALLAESGSYRLIDPDGLCAEPAYDIGVILRAENSLESVSQGLARCEQLSQLSKTDPIAVWQWGYIERVSTALYTLKLDLPEYGEPALAIANSWAEQNARHAFNGS